jgi:hypothetical protein
LTEIVIWPLPPPASTLAGVSARLTGQRAEEGEVTVVEEDEQATLATRYVTATALRRRRVQGRPRKAASGVPTPSRIGLRLRQKLWLACIAARNNANV